MPIKEVLPLTLSISIMKLLKKVSTWSKEMMPPMSETSWEANILIHWETHNTILWMVRIERKFKYQIIHTTTLLQHKQAQMHLAHVDLNWAKLEHRYLEMVLLADHFEAWTSNMEKGWRVITEFYLKVSACLNKITSVAIIPRHIMQITCMAKQLQQWTIHNRCLLCQWVRLTNIFTMLSRMLQCKEVHLVCKWIKKLHRLAIIMEALELNSIDWDW